MFYTKKRISLQNKDSVKLTGLLVGYIELSLQLVSSYCNRKGPDSSLALSDTYSCRPSNLVVISLSLYARILPEQR